ncbi:hypothetical protein H8D57_00535 [bacterium]|nr:hypothetical protein [bacterium]
MKTTINSIIILLLYVTLTHASDPRDRVLETQIKSSDEYRWGEAVNADPEKAKDAAKRNLCQNIWVAITTTSGHEVVETESSFQDSSVTSTQTYSALNLQNLKLLTFKEDDLTRAIAYIDTDSLSKSFETSKQKVRNMVKLALQAESEGKIGDALKGLYWAYLLTHTYVGELNLGFEGIDIADAKMAITRKIDKVISNIKIEADPCYRTAGSTHTALTLSYLGKPIQNIDFSYYCAMGDDQISLVDGEEAYISIYKELTQRRSLLPLKIEYIYAGEMRNQPEIRNLYKIFKDKCLELFVNVDLILPWIPAEKVSKKEVVDKEPPIVVPEVESLPRPAQGDWSISIAILASIKDKQEFQRELTILKDANLLYTASAVFQLFPDDKHYIALYCNEEVAALLYRDGEKYKNVRTGREYEDYRAILPAEGDISATWIGEVRK